MLVLKEMSLHCMGEQMGFFSNFSNLISLQYQFHTALKSEMEVLQIVFFSPAVPIAAEI